MESLPRDTAVQALALPSSVEAEELFLGSTEPDTTVHPDPGTQGRTEPPGDMKATALRSVAWIAMERWGSRLAALIVFALLGRLLQPAEIGLAALATVFVTFFGVLADQGFATALIQKPVIDDRDRNTAFWITVGTSVVLMVLVIACSPLASLAFHQPRLGLVLAAMSPTLVLGALAGTPEALLERDFQFKSLSVRTLISSVVGGVAGVVAAALGAGVWAIVVQTLVTGAAGVAVLWTVTPWRPGFAVSRESARELRATGISVLGIQFIGLINAQSDKLIVGAFLGPTDLGYYFVASRIITILLDVQTSVIEAVSLTTLSKLQHDKRRLRDAFYNLTGLGAASAIATFAVCAVTASVLLPLVFGPQWAGAAPIMQILCLMGCLNAIIVFDRNALIAAGAARAAFTITLVQMIVGVIAIGAAVPFGVVAVAVAVTARQYAVWPLRLRTLRRHLTIRIRTYLARWFGPMLSGVVVFGVGLALSVVWRPGSSNAERLAYLVVQTLVAIVLYTVTLRFTSPPAYREIVSIARGAAARSPVSAFIHRPRHRAV